MTERPLTAVQTVAQSMLCHPEWTIADHAGYLNFEAYHLDGDFTNEQVEALMQQARDAYQAQTGKDIGC